jgi:hypothetical protein
LNRFKKIILSKRFIPFAFAFFAVQAIIYASIFGFGIPSDEQYHFSSAQYYAQQPLLEGPFTEGQSPETIRDSRHIDRNTSYFYHYALSFLIRIFEAVGIGRDTQILLLRYVNVALAVLSLFVVKRILDLLSKDKIAKNLAIALYVLTGAAVWLAGSINYDNLAMLMWLGFIWLGILFIKRPRPNILLGLIALSLLTPITKFTYTPFMFVGLIIVLVLAWHKHQASLKQIDLKKILSSIKQRSTIILIVLTILCAGLFIERVGMNLVDYGRVQPRCDQTFTPAECRTNNVYNRGFEQSQKFSEEDQTSIVRDWDPFTHTGIWIYKMYNSLPWHLGHQRIESNNYSEVIAWLFAGLALVTALFSRRKISISTPLLFVMSLSAVYISGVFLRNLETYLTVGRMNAYQGRYLLPVLAFILFFLVLLVINSYRNMSGRTKTIFAWLWLIILPLYIVSHFTPLVTFVGVDSSWLEEYIIETTP